MSTRLALQSARCALLLRRRGVSAGFVTCEGRLPVVHSGGRCRVGRLALRGFVAPVELGALPGAELRIGDRVFINQGASVVASLSIEIADDVRIGDFAAVYDSEYHPVDVSEPVRREPVRIGANAWLGRAAMVLPGVTVGRHSVVAAGSVVTRDVPERTLVAGAPARVVRQLEAPDGWRRD